MIPTRPWLSPSYWGSLWTLKDSRGTRPGESRWRHSPTRTTRSSPRPWRGGQFPCWRRSFPATCKLSTWSTTTSSRYTAFPVAAELLSLYRRAYWYGFSKKIIKWHKRDDCQYVIFLQTICPKNEQFCSSHEEDNASLFVNFVLCTVFVN